MSMKLKINHEHFKKRIEKNPQMKLWLINTRMIKAAFMHCRKFNTCPYNPFIEGKPDHTHTWDMVNSTVVDNGTKK